MRLVTILLLPLAILGQETVPGENDELKLLRPMVEDHMPDPGITLIGSSGILAEIKPESCESKLYRWDGERLLCATIDRIGHVKVQRNHNMRALDVCRAEVTYLRGAALLAAMNNEQRAKCREMGKVFDETEVICTGSLTPGEEK